MELVAGQEWVSQTDGRRIVHVRDGLVRYWERSGNWYLNSPMSQGENEFREWIAKSGAWLVEPRLKFFLRVGQVWERDNVTREITSLHYGARNISWYERVPPTRGMFLCTGSAIEFEEWASAATLVEKPPKPNRKRWIEDVLDGVRKHCVVEGTPSSCLLVPIDKVEEVLREMGPEDSEDDD